MRRFVWMVCLVGCAPTLEPGFSEALTRTGGCGDVQFFAVDDGDTTLLKVWVEGLVDEATTAGETRTTSFDLPDPAIDVTLDLGAKVSDATCDDVIENGGPRVQRTLDAVDGKATITIVPGETVWDAIGTLLLEDVVFEDGDATLDHFEIDSVPVGWLAG